MSITIGVSREIEEIPVRAMILYFTVNHVKNSDVNPLIYEKTLDVIKKYKEVMDLSSIKKHHMIRVYRDFLWKLGIDPTKLRPSHEALLRRAIRTGSIPRINTIVDIGNYASLKHLVPVGIYDINKLKPPLTLRLSIDGEAFYPVGAETAKVLPRGIPLLVDQEKPIHIFPCRDSKFSTVDIKTTRILVIVAGVEGVPESTLYMASDTIVEYLKTYCDARGVSKYSMVYFGGRKES
ncbi:hypothetical protein J4526_00365 [Desulfurococcaceae archaeon MEX13E-LK6-19]|nr:hypothetical protein J4526_00365 [Desulfurococcaceae archaeon MEX13E-LK6-19]